MTDCNKSLIPMAIELRHCRFEVWPDCCRTTFRDGTSITAAPEDTVDYRQRAAILGYGEDTYRMCVEHEFLHSAVAEAFWDRPSPALWDVAHGKYADRGYEESIVLALQRRINEMIRFRG